MHYKHSYDRYTSIFSNLLVKKAHISICVEHVYLSTCLHIPFRYGLKNNDLRYLHMDFPLIFLKIKKMQLENGSIQIYNYRQKTQSVPNILPKISLLQISILNCLSSSSF